VSCEAQGSSLSKSYFLLDFRDKRSRKMLIKQTGGVKCVNKENFPCSSVLCHLCFAIWRAVLVSAKRRERCHVWGGLSVGRQGTLLSPALPDFSLFKCCGGRSFSALAAFLFCGDTPVLAPHVGRSLGEAYTYCQPRTERSGVQGVM